MIFRFSSFVLDIDVERTRAFYERSDVHTIAQQCSCINCQNFDKAIMEVPARVTEFLLSLGIDPCKPPRGL